ncbi:MAG TPA: hypothetical protein ACFYEK_01385 [Candidatus Wunengus sp. YC60]
MATVEAKIDSIHQMVHEQNVILAKHIAYQEMHAEMLKDHKKKIEGLEAHKNKTYGIAAVVSVVLTAIGHFISKIF